MPLRFRILSVFWFYQVAFNMDRFAISFAGPGILKSLSMGPRALGTILSSFALGYMLTQIPGGIFADRWRLKTLLVGLPVFWALFTGITGLVSTLSGFVITRICLGVAEGLAVPGIFRVVAETFDAKGRTSAMAISSTASALGPAFAGPMVGLLLTTYGWRSVFYAMTIPPLIAAVLVLAVLPERRRGAAPATHGLETVSSSVSATRLLRHPGLWLCALVFFLFNIAYWGYQGWMPSYLAAARHIDLKHLGLIGSIPYVLSFVGLLTFGILGTALDRWRSHLLAVSYVSAGVALYFAYGSATLVGSVAGLCCAAFFLSGGIPLFSSLIYELAPRKSSASYAGIIFTAGQIGGFVAPFTIGALVQKTTSYASGFALMETALILAGIGVVLLPFLSRPRRGPGETQLSVTV